MPQPCFFSEVDELAVDGASIDFEQKCRAPHGDTGRQKSQERQVFSSLVLLELKRASGGRKVFPAGFALKALDPARFALAKKSTISDHRIFAAKRVSRTGLHEGRDCKNSTVVD